MISRISRNAVKEGFDTLPAAICYFDRNGLLRLINHRMQELAAVLCGCDLQTLTDLEQALHSPGGGVQLRDEAARIYAFPDGTVYHFAVRPVQDKYGIPYTEVMATDVSRLAALHAALQQENERLADANRRAKRLYDNMPDIVREEEILKMKMQVHDDIGHTLLAARRALRHEHDLARIKREAAEWESSISLLCRARQEDAAEDPLTCMQRRAAVLGAAVQLRGAYPAARAARELYALILRECTSNAVRHAGATELYADSEHQPQAWHLCITNNGTPPRAEIGTAMSAEFTKGEMKVLRCLVRGLSYNEIAKELGIEPSTVKFHVINMLQKTNLENKLQLAIAATEAKLVVELADT